MATMNLYLPDALKADMESLEGVNWSQVAQQAFKQTVEIERTRKMDVTEAGLQRLRKGRVSKEERELAEGVAAGKRWALEDANYEELERVAAIDADESAWVGEPSAYGWGHGLSDAILGEGQWNRGDCESLCDQRFGKEYPSSDLVRGFVLGAQEVFEQV